MKKCLQLPLKAFHPLLVLFEVVFLSLLLPWPQALKIENVSENYISKMQNHKKSVFNIKPQGCKDIGIKCLW